MERSSNFHKWLIGMIIVLLAIIVFEPFSDEASESDQVDNLIVSFEKKQKDMEVKLDQLQEDILQINTDLSIFREDIMKEIHNIVKNVNTESRATIQLEELKNMISNMELVVKPMNKIK